VGHCPAGPDLLLDALQLLTNTARGWPAGGAGSLGAADTEGSGGGDATAAAADMQSARIAVHAWALTLQWVAQVAPRTAAKSALTRLASYAASLLCWPPAGAVQDCNVAASSSGGGGGSGAGIGSIGGGGEEASSSRSPPPVPSREASSSAGGGGGAPLRADSPVIISATRDRSDDGDGLGGGGWGEQHGHLAGLAPEVVCRPQGFLAGQHLMSQVGGLRGVGWGGVGWV